jgi:predicted 3-demethylubiquinone-9 3-methyltransferase (glyoxalase superfamily)
MMNKITPCLWFDKEAEQAVNFYLSVFKDGKVGEILRYGEGAPMPVGTVLTMTFEAGGVSFIALNGGPHFQFNEAISFSIDCKSQAEVDYYWDRLTADGGKPGQCGWLKDKYGVSWQVVPARMIELLKDRDPGRARRAMQAMMQMTKIDVARAEAAANG